MGIIREYIWDDNAIHKLRMNVNQLILTNIEMINDIEGIQDYQAVKENSLVKDVSTFNLLEKINTIY